MRVPGLLSASATRASPLANPAAPPSPSKLSVYEVGATTSVMVMRPVKRALTGPTRAVVFIRYSWSETRSTDSHPAMHALSTSGSLSARQVVSMSAGTVRLPFISMLSSVLVLSRREAFRTHAAARGVPRKRRGELRQTFEIVHRQKFIDVRQHRPDARRPRLEMFIAKQRIEPDEPAAGFAQALHFARKTIADIAVQTIGDQQHDRTLPEQAARPAAVELGETSADAGPAGPVRHGGAHAGDRDVYIALPQVPGDIGESRAKQKRVHAIAIVGDGMEKEQQHACVAVHRARDIAQHNQRRTARPAAPPGERKERAARGGHCAQRRA